jgi:histidine ammonia-lyase
VLREAVPGPGPDRFLAPEIEAAFQLVRSGRLVAATLPSDHTEENR